MYTLQRKFPRTLIYNSYININIPSHSMQLINLTRNKLFCFSLIICDTDINVLIAIKGSGF